MTGRKELKVSRPDKVVAKPAESAALAFTSLPWRTGRRERLQRNGYGDEESTINGGASLSTDYKRETGLEGMMRLDFMTR